MTDTARVLGALLMVTCLLVAAVCFALAYASFLSDRPVLAVFQLALAVVNIALFGVNAVVLDRNRRRPEA